MLEFMHRKGLWYVLASFLFAVMFNVIGYFVDQVSPRVWKTAVVKHAVPIDSEFEKLWELTAYIDCMTCLVSTESNVYFSGGLENKSRESLVNLDLPTGQVEWQQALKSQQSLAGLDSQYIYVNQSHTQKIANATQMWGAAEIIAYDIDSQDEVWNQKFAGSRGTSIDSIVDGVLMINAGTGFYQVDSHTGRQISGPPQQQFLLFNGEGIQYKRYPGLKLSGINIETKMPVWTYKHSGLPRFIFENDLIILDSTESSTRGGIVTLNGNTGEKLWEYRWTVSNVAVSNGVAYFIQLEEGIWGPGRTLDAQLLAVDIQTGEVLSTLHFDPSEVHGNYTYLVAASDDIVLVYLGDGSQLIALRFSPDK